MSSQSLSQGTTSQSFAPHPLKVIVFELNSHCPIYHSRPFGMEKIMNEVYKQERLWFLTENLYNLAISVDLEVPKGFFSPFSYHSSLHMYSSLSLPVYI